VLSPSKQRVSSAQTEFIEVEARAGEISPEYANEHAQFIPLTVYLALTAQHFSSH